MTEMQSVIRLLVLTEAALIDKALEARTAGQTARLAGQAFRSEKLFDFALAIEEEIQFRAARPSKGA